MKDYYVPRTKAGLKRAISRQTGVSVRYYHNMSKKALYVTYFRVMDKKLDHVSEFYRKNSLINFVD